MSKFDIKNKIDHVLYDFYNFIADAFFHLNFPLKKLVKKNIIYKNIHSGGRCFILGTGPSLKLLTDKQINSLGQEIVFGVNSFYKTKLSESIVPKYYVLMDNLYWEGWSNSFSDVEIKYKESPPVFITDPRAKKFADEANPSLGHIYICSKKYPTIKMSAQLDVGVYAAMNVISYSILSAIYMGFKEINLLGCDYNAFCTAGQGHAYDDKSELSETKYNLAFYLKFYWITTEFHYLIAKLAKENGVKIINFTPGSLLDAYPRRIMSADLIAVD